LAGTDKSQLLSAQVWIADMRLFEDHNSVWNEWVDPANPPARACLTTDFWRPGMLVEVMVVEAGHRSVAGTACFQISACKGIGVHKGSFAVSPRFRRLAGDSSGSQPPVQLACCLARSSPLRAQERRVFACPVLYRSGALGGIRTPTPRFEVMCSDF